MAEILHSTQTNKGDIISAIKLSSGDRLITKNSDITINHTSYIVQYNATIIDSNAYVDNDTNSEFDDAESAIIYCQYLKAINDRLPLRSEREMMLELALIAERESETFKLFSFDLVIVKTSYRAYCLDIHYLADNRKDKVLKLVPNANPDQPALYCLLSELPIYL